MRYQELLASEELDMILDEGAENARQVANKTLQRMKMLLVWEEKFGAN